MTVEQSRSAGPLAGIRVLSNEVQVAGPYCSMVLADRGADVIKLERPKYGDSAREGAPMVKNAAGERVSGYFMRFNRNKRSLTLNLREARGKEIYKELARRSDVVIDNLRPGSMDELGLGYADLAPLNPGLVYVSISGFGTMEELKGVYAGRPAYDIVAQAMGGLMYTCGQEGGPPTWLGIAMGDLYSAALAVQGIMFALFERTRTGKGQYVDISMYDGIISLAERSITAYSLTGRVLERGIEPFIAPWGPFQTQDGWIAIVVPTERDWARFCEAMGRPELAAVAGETDSGPARAKNMREGALKAIVEGWFAGHTTQEVVDRLLAQGLPVGPVQNAREIFECPHARRRGALIEVEDPVAGRVKLVAPPIKMSGQMEPIARPAPRLGEHNEQILCELLGYAPEQVEELRASGVL
jgi:crotonobetainyl-CoA:carnitine CoA-transferase CaiB-like acyl-CoA transferase